jgi:biopolymer transport protein ExbD
MALSRPRGPGARVTLVPLIDVLFILLVYFMVTSVYLDLDMIPAAGGDPVQNPAAGDAESADGGDSAGAEGRPPGGAAAAPGDAALAGALLVRIAPDGQAVLRGTRLRPGALEERLRAEARRRPDIEVVLLPSPRAPVQALATALDALARAGIPRSRILRLEGAP